MKDNIVLGGRRRSRFGFGGGRGLYSFFTLLLLCLLAVGAYFVFRDMSGPIIVMSPKTERITLNQDIVLELTDEGSGVRAVSAVVRYSGETKQIFEHVFAEERPQQKLTFNLANSGMKDSSFTLEIVARDTSFAGLGRGNSTTLSHQFLLDTQPPKIVLQTPPAVLKRGGAVVFVYSLSEKVASTGVQADRWFFPAFRMETGQYCCFVAFPLDAQPAKFLPTLMAKDLAGNIASMRLPIQLQNGNYRKDKLNVSDHFLSRKSLDLEVLAPEKTTDLERYIHINSVVREQNDKVLFDLAAKTSPTRLWSGDFVRLPSSALRAYYGEHRTYYYKDQVIDRQFHMGLDLASTAHAPIPAANDGKVLFSAPLGIYGNLVVIDHGMGLMSLYSHMSSVLVGEGDDVKKGQTIGHTGTTGLALGDHLHFGMLLNGILIQPMDWLDKNWVKAAVTDRIEAAMRR